VIEKSIHVSFTKTSDVDPRKLNDETDILPDPLNKLNSDDSNKDRDDHHSPQE